MLRYKLDDINSYVIKITDKSIGVFHHKHPICMRKITKDNLNEVISEVKAFTVALTKILAVLNEMDAKQQRSQTLGNQFRK